MKHSLLSIGFLFLFLAGCDEFSAPDDSSSASMESLTISPNSIVFDENVSGADSTLSIELFLTLREPHHSAFQYTVERQGELIETGDFQQQSDTEFTAAFNLEVSTSANVNYTVYAFIEGNKSTERIQGGITIRADITSPPQMVDAYNTEEVTIPEDGRERIDFYARVSHPDGQQAINSVNFFLIDQEGNQLLNSDFQMLDDGVFNAQEGRIDEAAGDSLYSRAFFIDSTNNPDDYTVFYYAISGGGLSSDTLQTQLRIIE